MIVVIFFHSFILSCTLANSTNVKPALQISDPYKGSTPPRGVYKQKPNWNTCWKLFSNNKLLLSHRNKLQEEERCTPLIWSFVHCFIVHYKPFTFTITEKLNVEN